MGLPAEHDHRVALSIPPPSQDQDYVASAPGADAAPANGNRDRGRDGNSIAWRRAEIPAASGFGNARSVALVQSVMACGGTVHGVRLLSQAGCDRACAGVSLGCLPPSRPLALARPVHWVQRASS
jgi:hypothetical protein